MKKFKSIFKNIRGKSSKEQELDYSSGELAIPTINGIKRVVKYLECIDDLPRGLYTEPGFIEEIRPLEGLICSGKVSEGYLASLRSIHSIAMV